MGFDLFVGRGIGNHELANFSTPVFARGYRRLVVISVAYGRATTRRAGTGRFGFFCKYLLDGPAAEA